MNGTPLLRAAQEGDLLALSALLLGQVILRVGLISKINNPCSSIINRAQPEHPVAKEIDDCRAIDC